MTSLEIANSLEALRLPCGTEEQLQRAIASHLSELGVEYSREHRLSAEDRPDFFLPAGVAVEVKIRGSLSEVTRQLMRYAEHDVVTELLLVTSRLQLASVPRTLNEKPVRVAVIWGCL